MPLCAIIHQNGHLELQLIIDPCQPAAKIFMLATGTSMRCRLYQIRPVSLSKAGSWVPWWHRHRYQRCYTPAPWSRSGSIWYCGWHRAFKATFLSQSVAIFGAFSLSGSRSPGRRSEQRQKGTGLFNHQQSRADFCLCRFKHVPVHYAQPSCLIVFHAIIKALLFLCVGAIEQRIDSRDIEDMRGLYANMPLTALITVMGVIMMIMPPFGVLLSKWMAMEAAARNLYHHHHDRTGQCADRHVLGPVGRNPDERPLRRQIQVRNASRC